MAAPAVDADVASAVDSIPTHGRAGRSDERKAAAIIPFTGMRHFRG
jgi:hypothetical protein